MTQTRTVALPEEEAPTSLDPQAHRSRDGRPGGPWGLSRRSAWVSAVGSRIPILLFSGAMLGSFTASVTSTMETRKLATKLQETLELVEHARSNLRDERPSAVSPEVAPTLGIQGTDELGAMPIVALERRAAESAAAKDYAAALRLYRELLNRSPDSSVLRDFVMVLRHKAGCWQSPRGLTDPCARF